MRLSRFSALSSAAGSRTLLLKKVHPDKKTPMEEQEFHRRGFFENEFRYAFFAAFSASRFALTLA